MSHLSTEHACAVRGRAGASGQAEHVDALALKDAQCEQTIDELTEKHRASLVAAENNCAVATQKQQAADVSMKQYWDSLARKRNKKRHWKGEHQIAVTEIDSLKEQLEEVREKCEAEKAAMRGKLAFQMNEVAAMRKKMEDTSGSAWLREQELSEKLSEASKDLSELNRLLEVRPPSPPLPRDSLSGHPLLQALRLIPRRHSAYRRAGR